jgi:hypothetical protein
MKNTNKQHYQAHSKIATYLTNISWIDINNLEHLNIEQLKEVIEALENTKKVIDKYKK